MKNLFMRTISEPWKTGGLDVQYRIVRKDKSLYLYFQQTVGMSDWIHNFMIPCVPYKNMKEKFYVHAGFLRLWKSVRDVILSKVREDPAEFIYVYGFSQGAALATLAYEDLLFHFPNSIVSAFVFGCPRVVWLPSYRIAARFSLLRRVTVRGDIVAHLPPSIFGYRHVGYATPIGPSSVISFRNHEPERYVEYLDEGWD